MSTSQSIQNQSPPIEREASEPKTKRKFSLAERTLLPVALTVAVLCDRLLIAGVSDSSDDMITSLAGIFWICYLIIFYAFYWRKLASNRILWYVAGCSATLCVWNFLFSFKSNPEFSILTYFVIPNILMAHAQYAAGDYKPKDAGAIAAAWLSGWVVKPFSGLPAFFGATGSLISGTGKSTARKAALGIAVTLPLLGVIIPLLTGADQVFGYYVKRLLGGWNFTSLVCHIVVIAVAFGLFYSFLWNVGFGEKGKPAQNPAMKIDALICRIILGSVVFLYILFCAVQFTYLFAGAGLPPGMTYSEYAREGFAQTVAVCAINLLIFGAFTQFSEKGRAIAPLLASLLALTAVMLFSGFIRLSLYIGAYGLTWLRLLSAWFVIYLAAVIILCGIRMTKEKLPVIALSALILLGWYTALGYSNPNALISRYNQSHGYDISVTADKY